MQANRDPMTPALYRVGRYARDTYDTFTIGLQPADPMQGPARFPYAPGQFNMLYVFGIGEVPISISGDPRGEGVLTHTTRTVGAITKAMSALKVGDMVGVRGPFGTSWPVEKAKGRDVIVVAGGIGLAPLRPVILAIIAERASFHKVILLYGARTPRDVLFPGDLKKWKSKYEVEVYSTVDRASRTWKGSVGVVTRPIPQLAFDAGNSLSMICGPEIMMHFTVQALKQRGMKEPDIYISMERNMKCAVGLCGHCQFGPHFICKDGPVFSYDRLASILRKREI